MQVDTVEVIWILVTGAGLYFAFQLLRLAQADLRELKENDADKKLILQMNRRFGATIALYLTYHLYLGIDAAFLPSSPIQRTLHQEVLIGFFLGFQVLFAVGLWLNLRDRRRLLDL